MTDKVAQTETLLAVQDAVAQFVRQVQGPIDLDGWPITTCCLGAYHCLLRLVPIKDLQGNSLKVTVTRAGDRA